MPLYEILPGTQHGHDKDGVMVKVPVLSEIRHGYPDGTVKTFHCGELIELTEKEAAGLLAAGTVKLAQTQPATPKPDGRNGAKLVP